MVALLAPSFESNLEYYLERFKQFLRNTYFKNMAVPVLHIVLAIAFHDFVILKICLLLSGSLGSSSSLLKSFNSSVLSRFIDAFKLSSFFSLLFLLELPPPVELALGPEVDGLPSMDKIFLAILNILKLFYWLLSCRFLA